MEIAYFLVTRLSSPSSAPLSREADYKLIEIDRTCLPVYLIATSKILKVP